MGDSGSSFDSAPCTQEDTSLEWLEVGIDADLHPGKITEAIINGNKFLNLDFRRDLAVLVEVPSSPCAIIPGGPSEWCVEVIGFDIMTCQPKLRHERIWTAIKVLRSACSQLNPPRRLVLRGFLPNSEFNQSGSCRRMISEFEDQFTAFEWHGDQPVSFADNR